MSKSSKKEFEKISLAGTEKRFPSGSLFSCAHRALSFIFLCQGTLSFIEGRSPNQSIMKRISRIVNNDYLYWNKACLK